MSVLSYDDAHDASVRIGREVVAAHADACDRDRLFPRDALAALRTEGLLSLAVPTELGGPGLSVLEIARTVAPLAGHDPSLGIILTMHHSQVVVLARYAKTPALQAFVAEVHEHQLLLANANSEVTVGGTERASRCCVEPRGDGRFVLVKDSPVISYGDDADAIVVTARRHRDADDNDQVLAICRAADTELTATGSWDTLGLRATGSLPRHLEATGSLDLVLPDAYDRIVNETGLPVTNVMFGEMWLGIAEAAAAVAHAHVRRKARAGGSPLPAVRLAELAGVLDQLRGLVQAASRAFEAADGTEAAQSLALVMQLQTLKVTGTQLLVDVVARAMTVVGLPAYRNDGPASLGRLLRDAYGCCFMVGNDGVLSQNAQLLLVRKSL